MLNFFYFWLSDKSFITSILNDRCLSEQNIVGYRFFPFRALTISCHSLLACRVSAEKSADSLMGTPFSFAYAFRILSLTFTVLLYVLV